ncbi:MAG: hypothetical protein RBS17_07360 [Coriobacteriia bacterium]|nr:hypothetical protein [Coriobacteriia bacterium]
MKSRKMIALVALGLTAGLVLGSVGVSYAATDTESTSPVMGAGMRMGQTIRDAGARLIDVVADLTGLSVEEVRVQRAEGESVADIAEANGSSSDAVVSTALESRKALLDAKVADGTVTQEQADLAYDQMTERVTERVSTDEAGRPSWAGQGRGQGGQGGRGGQGGQGGGMGARDGSCTATQ